LDSPKDAIASLAPDSLLRALEPAQLEALLDRASPRSLEAGDTIIEQGDEDGDFAVFVLSGGLKVSFVSAGGREIILSYCRPGELVGEIALLDSGPRTATVTAAVTSSVLLLLSRSFLETLMANPDSMVRVMRELAQRVRQQNLVIESDRTFSAGPRLALALVRLIDREEGEGRLLYSPSQSDLGAFAGLSRESVSRLLSEWENRGIVSREGRELRICDGEYLKLMAEFGEEA
jgi:CRP-like cAMP-binding protein